MNNLRSSAETIAVVDYGMGNLRSVAKALEHVAEGARVVIAHDAASVRDADRVVFPGQGAMVDCMRHLRETGMVEAIERATRERPFMGVCMGEEMLFGHSEEGDSHGLGLLPGRVVRFPKPAPPARLKVPHMGWNRVHATREHPVWDGIPQGSYFYFVHSYYAVPDDPDLVAATSDYGITFTCAIARNNIFATQFHPEKSADLGLRLYRNFLQWRPA